MRTQPTEPRRAMRSGRKGLDFRNAIGSIGSIGRYWVHCGIVYWDCNGGMGFCGKIRWRKCHVLAHMTFMYVMYMLGYMSYISN